MASTKHNLQGLAGQIYTELRKQILSLALQPGAGIQEEALAHRMNASRTPVREALVKLEMEGLVRRYPKQCAIVTELTLQDIVEAFQIREFIEPPAAALVAGKLDQEMLRDLLDRMLAILTSCRPQAGRFEEHDRLDTNLHDSIIAGLGNRRLCSLMENIRGVCLRARSVGTRSRFKESCEEDITLIQALINGDAILAEETMRCHLVHARQCLLGSAALHAAL